MYPEARKMVAYGEFRAGYEKDSQLTKLVFYGMRYLVENYVAKKWTVEDVILSEAFFNTHNAGNTPFPFPKDLFLKFIREHNGYFPVKIEALPEGSVIYPHVPVYQITATNEYSRLVTYLETVLTMIWYPTTVATLSRRCKHVLKQAYDETVDQDGFWTLDSRLHDFGFRGCTSVEQSIIGGSAHLLNFSGTDTMTAAYYVQYRLNNGNPIGTSIPATEHSVMTAHTTEKAAMEQLLNEFGSGVVACVMDSYDYTNALEKVLPSVAKLKTSKGGFLVLRPDSGDPVSVILEGLRAAEKVFGATVNKKGYKVLNGVGVIQGDAVTYASLKLMVQAIKEAGYSVQNCAFGMGGGLLQKVNRDTMSFATKLCHITYADGKERDVMKTPKTDAGKVSLPGELSVKRNEQGVPMVYPKESNTVKVTNGSGNNDMLRVVYDHGPLPESAFVWDDFETIRQRVEREWAALPDTADVVSVELKEKMKRVRAEVLASASQV